MCIFCNYLDLIPRSNYFFPTSCINELVTKPRPTIPSVFTISTTSFLMASNKETNEVSQLILFPDGGQRPRRFWYKWKEGTKRIAANPSPWQRQTIFINVLAGYSCPIRAQRGGDKWMLSDKMPSGLPFDKIGIAAIFFIKLPSLWTNE